MPICLHHPHALYGRLLKVQLTVKALNRRPPLIHSRHVSLGAQISSLQTLSHAQSSSLPPLSSLELVLRQRQAMWLLGVRYLLSPRTLRVHDIFSLLGHYECVGIGVLALYKKRITVGFPYSQVSDQRTLLFDRNLPLLLLSSKSPSSSVVDSPPML